MQQNPIFFKTYVFLIFIFGIFSVSVSAQAPNDCQFAVIVCGNSSLSVDVSGVGSQELNNSNTCQSQENNSIWLTVNIATSGTLGFTLTPQSTNINEDYDFFVFGPNVSCGNIGQAIRCSTTNPAASNQGNNLTGMNAASTETSEGPGDLGNSFVKQLDVLAGESYFIVIDRPVGNSPFSLEWTGTATFPDNPSNPLTQEETNLEICDNLVPFSDGIAQVDINALKTTITNGELDKMVSFHSSESDAILNTDALSTVFENTASPQTYFIRIENSITGCFILNEFTLTVNTLSNFNTPSNFELCDDETDGNAFNGQTRFDFNLKTEEIIANIPDIDYSINYYSSLSDAQTETAALPLNYDNTAPTPIEVFVRIDDNTSNCVAITSFNLEVLEIPVANDISIIQCDEDGLPEGFTLYDLTDYSEFISDDEPNRDLKFYTSMADLENDEDEIDATAFTNDVSPQIVFALVINTQTGCSNTAEVTLETSSTASNDTSLEACDYDGTEDGFYNFDLQDAEAAILLGLPIDLNLSYYETYENALTETDVLGNSFTNSIPYNQTIYARVENANACFGISKIELIVYELPNLLPEETVYYCLNTFPQTSTLTGGLIESLPNNYYYEWSTGETTSEIEINAAGTYSVRVTTTDGCFKDRTITVLPSNIATITNIEITDASSNNSISVLVSGEGSYQYALDNPNGLYQDSNVFENVPFGFHTVYVRDVKNNCGIVDKLVSVIGFPKYFTPNGDTYNPYWQVKGISSNFQPDSQILIYDRMGKLLKELDPLGPGWDGTWNGQLMPSSDYWFVVKLQDGRTFKGHFSLKR
ncbi:T9SS type B sorting domain-containing protein [Subsaximicrobium wynnwilliamsii]|uniref:T9SS type B sorting domain-containing protein n=1 Tax=Subsaximicrobium wynnwilliamsii TaxID=291179 RepID=A0A5C6ZK90_9FLAO|nr:T9SS type B sorting domain-containing protein [Subsaximicrobium wynnwilliamsii]TXD84953.1 T9SS type B sorting domain-containing protein [Subsaximicrobium wynnwilliamsii]TXD90624.1 T9SS type B sorting domain-containing protein [Subsaximicrobium wynnwilliamsii]TXE05098.1 T9SS type B sorting domain-containing protein [Subsaximicrobium wynnwilliamsii]